MESVLALSVADLTHLDPPSLMPVAAFCTDRPRLSSCITRAQIAKPSLCSATETVLSGHARALIGDVATLVLSYSDFHSHSCQKDLLFGAAGWLRRAGPRNWKRTPVK
ncbi:hypothetical protein DL98DRAFT_512637 [Cadophora sp. DSE1049]|nr:hypothetical protein DL98DRAFT_512637 [Cadophora sp. DSE1049]